MCYGPNKSQKWQNVWASKSKVQLRLILQREELLKMYSFLQWLTTSDNYQFAGFHHHFLWVFIIIFCKLSSSLLWILNINFVNFHHHFLWISIIIFCKPSSSLLWILTINFCEFSWSFLWNFIIIFEKFHHHFLWICYCERSTQISTAGISASCLFVQLTGDFVD